MRMTSWLDSFRSAPRRPGGRARPLSRSAAIRRRPNQHASRLLLVAEALEDRTLLSGSPLGTQSVILQQGVSGYTGETDAYVSAGKDTVDQNFAGSQTLFTRGGANGFNSFIKFDLSGVSGSGALQSVTLTLNVTTPASGTFDLYALSTSWDPNSVTYQQAATNKPWANAGGDYNNTVLGSFTAASAGQVTVTLNSAGVAAVQSWLNSPSTNYGFAVVADSGSAGKIGFSSNLDPTPANHPSLSLSFQQQGLYVSAGPDQGVVQTSLLSLNGTVQDNNPSAPGPLTTNWSLVSGPGTVTFENPSSPTTHAFFSDLGTYVLQLSASDGQLSGSSQVNITVTNAAGDLPPVVSAGANQTINLNQTANLAGTAIDGGPYQLSYQWSQLSGPGTTTFTTPQSLATMAQFSAAGTYVLNLVASDGQLASNSTVTITVNNVAVNQPPVVSAGTNQTVNLGTTVNLAGTVTDDHFAGTTLTTTWQLANGPGTVTFGNPSALATTATFSAAGQYYLRLTASDGQYTDQSFVIITVNAPPQPSNFSLQQGTNSYSGATDTYISTKKGNNTTNYGTSTTLTVAGGANEQDALLRWDLSGISGTVTSATITLDVSTASTGTFNVYALSRPWIDSQATFQQATNSVAWQVAGANGSGDYNSTVLGTLQAPAAGFATITLNAAGIAVVQSWLANPSTNNGFVIKNPTNSLSVVFFSAENSTASTRPMLTLNMQPSGGGSGGSGSTTITDPVAAANTAFLGANGQRTGYMSSLGLQLATLYYQYLYWQQNGSHGTFSTTSKDIFHLSGNNVLVDVVANNGQVSALQTSLQALGMQVTGVYGKVISGWMPIGQLGNAAITHGLSFALPSAALPKTGAVTEQGDTAQQSNTARSQFNVDGSGVTVGVISDSFNNLGTAQQDINTGDLPTNIRVLLDNPTGGTDEGRAMLQIVHDVAPGSSLAFATGNLGEASFAQEILALAGQAGANIIVDDLIYFDEPFFQEGIVAQAVDQVASQGVAYFSAAGNDGRQSYQDTFRNSSVAGLLGGTLQNFASSGPVTTFQQVTIPVGTEVVFDFQWDQPFASAGGAGSASQMDFFLYSSPNVFSTPVAEGINVTVGGDPIQLVDFFNDGSFGTQTFYVAIEHDSGPLPGVIKYIAITDGAPFTINTFNTNSSTDFGHAMALGAASVGAAFYEQTPAFGVSPPQLEPFSSSGGLSLLFDTSGNRLTTPITRQQPMFVGPDGVDTTFFPTGPGNDVDGDGFPNFFGTSAAAPNVAAVGALMLQAAGGPGSVSSQTLFSTLEQTAIPMGGSPGYNVQSGFGLVNADAAVQAIRSAPHNQVPQVTLSASGNPFSENGGKAVVTATLSKAATSTVVINLSFGGTAAINTQYTASSAQIIIQAGQTSGSITITGKSDGVNTGDLTVLVSVFSVQNAALAGGSQQVNLIRLEADGPPKVALTVTGGNPTSNSFIEANGTVTVTATLTKAATTPIVIQLGFSGDAILGTNFNVSSSTITIAAGQTSGSITITGINTNQLLPTKEIFITILSVSPSNAATVAIGGGIATALEIMNSTSLPATPTAPQISLSLAGSPASENGGQMVVTISQSTPSLGGTAVQLTFTGTAVLGTNYRVTDANGNSIGNNGFVFISSGTSTTITITGIDDFKITPNLTVTVTASAVQGTALISPTAGSVTGTFVNVDTTPGVSLSASDIVFTEAGGQTQITATLNQPFTQDVTVNLAFSGQAIANLDYSVTSDQAATQHTTSILIPAGQTSGSVWLTGSTDSLFESEETAIVTIASVSNGTALSSQNSVTTYLVDQQVPVEFFAQDTVVAAGGVATVTVQISRPLPFAVSVQYQTVDGTATAGSGYTASSGTITFAAGQTSQTIYIPTHDNPIGATQSFFIKLTNPVLNAPQGTSGATPPTVGTQIDHGSATDPITVTLLNSIGVSQNFTATTSASSGGLPSPPDIAGASGNGFEVLMVNGQYQVFNQAGQLISQTSLTQFWTNSGIQLKGTPFSPRVIFANGLWLAVALDQNLSNGVEQPNNNILFAVSLSGNPTQSWKGFTIPSDPSNSKAAIGVSLGFGGGAVIITTDNNDGTETITTVPDQSVFAQTPATGTVSQFFSVSPSVPVQPVYNPGFDFASFNDEALFGLAAFQSSSFGRFDVINADQPFPDGRLASESGPTPIASPVPFTQTLTSSGILLPAALPGAPQPGTSQLISTGNNGIESNIYQVGDDLWLAQTVVDPATGHTAIQWIEFSYASNTILQHGLITDPNVSFYNPSIAANAAGEVVIGFTGSGALPGEFASAYAVMGTTTGGVTTFTTPMLLKQGQGDYTSGNTGTSPWGLYSSTTVDPSTTDSFWTFQQYASGTNQWGVGVFKITFSTPTQTTGPSVTLSASNNAFAENGGSVTVTATLASAATAPVIIDLGFSGTAIANVDYAITNPGTAPGNSPVRIVIPAGSTTGSVVLTGLNNPNLTGSKSIAVSILSVNNAAPTTPQEVDLSVVSSSLPQIAIEDLAVDQTTTATAHVVVHLSGSVGALTLHYTTNDGTAHAGTDYTAESGTLNFAAGQTTGTIDIPLLNDPTASGALTFTVTISGQSAGIIVRPTATVTILQDHPEISIQDQTAVQTAPSTAQITVQLAQAVSVPVTVHYQTVDGTAHAGVDYTSRSGTIIFAANQTTQTINVPILANSAQDGATQFFVQLSSASLGTIVRDTATVTLFDHQPGSAPPEQFQTPQSNTNFTADTSASGTNAPANPSGAVGPNAIVVFDSNSYQVINKGNGAVPQSSSLNQFWINAGITLPAGDNVYQPHVVYDPSTGRWYASALDGAIPNGSSGPATISNRVLLAVSKTSDPTQGWVGFAFTVDPAGLKRADFDQLGFDSNSVVVTANIFNIADGTAGTPVNMLLLSVPKADLTGASPTVTRATLNAALPATPANSYNAALNYDSTASETLIGETNAGIYLETVTGGGGPTASVNSPVFIANSTLAPVAAPQPAGAPPLTTGPTIQTNSIDGLDGRFSGTVVQVGNHLWAAQTIFNSTTGTDAIAWYDIDLSTNTILQHGVISDPSLYFYYPSLSVDAQGNVAIGFSGSSLTQQISSYAVYGTTANLGTANETTTFTSPILLKQGTGIYAGFSNATQQAATLATTGATFNTTGVNNTDTVTVNLATPAGPNGALIVLGFSGTAIANRDYNVTNSALNTNGTTAITNVVGAPIEIFIAAGQSSGSVVLTGLNSALASGDETLKVSVVSINGAAPTTPTQTTLNLVNPTLPKISIEDQVVVESTTSTAQVLVRLNEPVLTTTFVQYSTANGTAIAGTDYTTTSGTLTFNPGQTVATINVPILANGAADGKSFVINLTIPASNRGTIADPQGVVTLLTTTPPATAHTVSLSLSPNNFAEDSGSVTVTATLDSVSTSDTLINLSFGGTATFGRDYSTTGESIVILAGQTTGSITLTGNGVPIGASAESVTVGFNSVAGATPSGPAVTATLNPGNVASGTISGSVKDNSGVGLAGIVVYLVNGAVTPTGAFNPSQNLFTTTDANGNYSFTGLAPGNYTVQELLPTNYVELLPPNFTTSTPFAVAIPVTVTTGGSATANFRDQLSAVWGSYSSTAIDPSNPGVFWTFQAIADDQAANDFNTWGVQATQLAVTNYTADQTGLQLAHSSIPVTLTASGNLLSPLQPQTITVSIPVQQTDTTIYLGFTGSAVGNVDYFVSTSRANNSYFVTGAPVQVIIPAGQTTGSITLFGTSGGSSPNARSLTVSVTQINLATPAVPETPVSLTVASPTISLEGNVAIETGPGSTATADLKVLLSGALPVPVTIQYSTLTDTPHNGTVPATAGVDYTAESNQTLIIPAGSTSGTISIPIANDAITQAETFLVSIASGAGTVVGSPATVTLLNTEPPANTGPGVAFQLSPASFDPNGGTATFTATLASASPTDAVINLNFSSVGGPVEGTDYTVTSDTIVIPAGQTTGSVTITGANRATGVFQVTAVSANGAVLGTTNSFQATINAPTTTTTTSGVISGRVLDQNGNPMAGVYVYLALPVGNNQYDPNDPAFEFGEPFVTTDSSGQFTFRGLTVPGNYAVSELVPPNYVSSSPTGNYYAVGITSSNNVLTYTTNQLNGGAAVTTTSTGAGIPLIFRNTIAESADPTGAVGPNDVIVADNNNFIVYNKVTGTVEQSMTLDQFWLAAWNQETRNGTGTGFSEVLMNAYEPRVVFDAASGRWYVSALDDSNPPYTPFSGTNGFSAGNDILLAVSKDSDPLDGWVQFVIPADSRLFGLNPDPLGINGRLPSARPFRADADTIGFNAALNSTALILTANLYDAGSGETSIANDGADPTAGDFLSTAIISIPKEFLLSATTTNDPVVMNNFTSVSEGAFDYGINPQAVVSYDANGAALVLAQGADPSTGVLDTSKLLLTSILGSGTSFSISGNPISIPLPANLSAPISAPQPNHAPPIATSTETPSGAAAHGVGQNSALNPGLVSDGIDNRLSNVVEIGGNLWVAQTVLDTSNTSANAPQGTDAIAWWEISLTTNQVVQGGLITSKGTSDPGLFFFFPSIAVNAAGDVVIGFQGSDTTQFISSYTAVGTTIDGLTTFTAPTLLKQGVGVFTGVSLGAEPGAIGPSAVPPAPPTPSPGTPPTADPRSGARNFALWGGYSTTAVDPSNPNSFWTFQQIADAQFSTDINTYGVQATRISVDEPSVTLTVSGPAPITTTQQLALFGDSLSAGDVTGTTPGWVSQLTATGKFTVPIGGNQATDGATTADLASQLPQIQSLAGSLNYTTVIIGGNDAVNFVSGNETAAQYISSVEGNIETTLTALQSANPADHIILGTVPDIFVTPQIQAMNLSATTITADKSVMQQVNADLTKFALAHGIGVIDLFAATDALLTAPLNIGGLTITTDQLFAPDGFHPSAIVQGLIANMVIDAADVGFGAGLTPISDQQLLINVGLTATVTGPTYFNVAPYVLSPAAPSPTQTITATLSAPSSHDVVVNVSLGGSVEGQDYFSSSQFIVIPAGQTSGSITLTSLGKPSAVIVAAITSLEGAVEPSAQQVTTVLTNTPSIVTLSLSGSPFSETSGTATVTATLSAASNSDTVINLSFGGTAVLGQDYRTSAESIVIPAGQTSGSITLTGNNNLIAGDESVIVTMTSVTGAYSQVPQQVTATLTVGNLISGSISGEVFQNTAGQPGIPGVIVYIGAGAFDPTVDPFTTTDANGNFTFAGLAAGTYTIQEVVPSGLQETSPAGGSYTVMLTTGQQVTGINFGNTAPTGISLFISNGTIDGNRGTATVTARLPQAATNNVVVFVTLSGTAIQGSQYFATTQQIVIPAGQTSGSLVLTGLPVNFDRNNTITVTITGAINAVVGSGASVTATLTDDSLVATGGLQGTVFNDANVDKVQDNGETGLPFAQVWVDVNNTGQFNAANDPFTYTTTNSGAFNFQGLLPGTYRVYQTAPAGLIQTSPPNTQTGGTFYSQTVNTTSVGGLNFGDTKVTNPGVSLSMSTPTISASGGTATLTVNLSQSTAVPVTVVLKASGLAPFTDYQIAGVNGVVTITPTSPTFSVVISPVNTSASFTITANGASLATLETLIFDIVGVTNASVTGQSEAETAIVPLSGAPRLEVDDPSQVAASGRPGAAPAFTNVTFTSGAQPVWVATGDLNGDGRADMVVANSGNNTLTVYLNHLDANGNLAPTSKTLSLSAKPTSVTIADLNGDGNQDIIVTTISGVTVFKGDGLGNFTLQATYGAGTTPSAVAVGDFNGDGIMDMAVANSGSNNVSILMGQGNFGFQNPVNINVGPTPADIKAVDLNNDGKLDLVVANSGLGPFLVNGVNVANTVAVLTNNGSGTFTTTFIQAGIQPNSLAVADFNLDGRPDVAVANVGFNPNQSGNINTVSVLYNNGVSLNPVGIPMSQNLLPTGAFLAGPSVWRIAAGDVNGDGKPDIIVANNGVNDNSITVLLNNGNATFQPPTPFSVGSQHIAQSVAVGDFYGNGAVDIAAATSIGMGGTDGLTVLKNQNVPRYLLFHVYLSSPSTSTVTVRYATHDGTANALLDYVPQIGTLTFAPGQTVETVAVPLVNGARAGRTVYLQLSSATNVPIEIGTGVGTISPAVPPPSTFAVSATNGNLNIGDSTQNDIIHIVQINPGVIELLVNGVDMGTYSGVTGTIGLTTWNGLDTVVVDEEVSVNGVVVDPVLNTAGDSLFAELATGASWLLEA